MGNCSRLIGTGPYLTSKSITDYEIAHPDPKVTAIGHRKPYSSEPMCIKKLSAKKEKKDGNT